MDHCGLKGSTPTGECRLLQIPPLTHCLSVSSNFSLKRLQGNNRQGCFCVIRRRGWTNAPWGGLKWTWRVKQETSRVWASSQTHETPPSPAERPLLFRASFSPAKGEKVTDRGIVPGHGDSHCPRTPRFPWSHIVNGVHEEMGEGGWTGMQGKAF